MKTYKITRTYIIDIEDNKDIQEIWRNVENEIDYVDDEQIELVSEVK